MSRAKQLIQEANFDKQDIMAAADSFEWAEAAKDILQDAENFYARLKKQNVIALLQKHRRRGALLTGFDPSAVAQAVLRLTLDRRNSTGARRAYNLIRRWEQ